MIKQIILTATILVVGCNQPTNPPHDYYNDLTKGTINSLSSNEKQILSAIILNRNGNDSSEIVLISDTTLDLQFRDSYPRDNDTFPAALRIMFDSINDNKYYIGDIDLDISNDYRYYDSAKEPIGWDARYARYPNSRQGIFSFSKIAINSDSTQAIVYVQWYYGILGADGGFISMCRINGRWNVLFYWMLWIS